MALIKDTIYKIYVDEGRYDSKILILRYVDEDQHFFIFKQQDGNDRFVKKDRIISVIGRPNGWENDNK